MSSLFFWVKLCMYPIDGMIMCSDYNFIGPNVTESSSETRRVPSVSSPGVRGSIPLCLGAGRLNTKCSHRRLPAPPFSLSGRLPDNHMALLELLLFVYLLCAMPSVNQ